MVVAGTICAEGNNDVGVSGVAWDRRLLLSELEAGRLPGGGSFYSNPVFAQQRIVRVAVAGARIFNMSLQWIDTNACSTRGFDDPMPLIIEQRALTLREWTVGTNRILGAAAAHASGWPSWSGRRTPVCRHLK